VNNLATSKNRALEVLNEKSLEFISILDIAYPTVEKKISILTRIMKAYELNETKETEILNYLTKQCQDLNK